MMLPFSSRRRALLMGAGGAAGVLMGSPTTASNFLPAVPNDLFRRYAAAYNVAPDIVNLENAYYGVMSQPVAEIYQKNISFLNQHSSFHLRKHFDGPGIEAIRKQVSLYAGVSTHEIALTRSATESLQNIIANYQPLKADDTVMIGNLDYGSVMDAMRDLAHRRRATVVVVDIPEPATHQNVIDAYEEALRRHPKTRLLLLTHISHRTGLIIPVAEIVRIAKSRNVDVVVDIAQSFGLLETKISDLGADFVGGNLHKWIGAPLGTGFLYIRSERLSDIGIHQGNSEFPVTDIRARVHVGTHNVPAVMTIPSALAFHATLPPGERLTRLRDMRSYWVSRVQDFSGVQILTPDEARMTGPVTSFRLSGHTSFQANSALANLLVERYRIFTVARTGPLGGSCIRVTPSYYTTKADLDRLVEAIRDLSSKVPSSI